jgi:hypothetical protein
MCMRIKHPINTLNYVYYHQLIINRKLHQLTKQLKPVSATLIEELTVSYTSFKLSDDS